MERRGKSSPDGVEAPIAVNSIRSNAVEGHTGWPGRPREAARARQQWRVEIDGCLKRQNPAYRLTAAEKNRRRKLNFHRRSCYSMTRQRFFNPPPAPPGCASAPATGSAGRSGAPVRPGIPHPKGRRRSRGLPGCLPPGVCPDDGRLLSGGAGTAGPLSAPDAEQPQFPRKGVIFPCFPCS